MSKELMSVRSQYVGAVFSFQLRHMSTCYASNECSYARARSARTYRGLNGGEEPCSLSKVRQQRNAD